MLCNLRKWRISKAFDTEKPLSRSLERHVRTCRRCRDFFQLGIALQKLSPHVFAVPSATDLSHLSQRIIDNLDANPVLEKPTRKNPLLIPALVSTLALTAVVLVVVALLPSPSDDIMPLNPLSQWSAAQGTVSSLWGEVQSPYQKEWENIKSSLNATADFFLNFVELPTNIE